MPKIIIRVRRDGSVDLQAQGYVGRSCEEATRFLEEQLGQLQSRKHTPEYYLTEPAERIRLEQTGDACI